MLFALELFCNHCYCKYNLIAVAALMGSRWRGPRMSAVPKVATCGSVSPSTLRSVKATRQLWSNLSPKRLRDATAEAATSTQTTATTRCSTRSPKRRSATQSPTGPKHLHRSAPWPREQASHYHRAPAPPPPRSWASPHTCVSLRTVVTAVKVRHRALWWSRLAVWWTASLLTSASSTAWCSPILLQGTQ